MKEKVISLLQKPTKLSKQEISKLIEIPPNPDLGDFAFPTFILAKTLKKNPVEIAKTLAKKIKPNKSIEKIQPQGPYVNFFINSKTLVKTTLENIQKEKDKYGEQKIREKAALEYIGPNTNKPLHVGHVRNIVIGQSIAEILKFAGNKVTLVNINNDKGAHICKSMIAYEKFGKNKTPEKAKKKSDHFVGDFYVLYNNKVKENPKLEEETKLCLQKLEKGNKQTLALWKRMNAWALEGFEETYKKFNVKINKNYYESKLYKKGKKVVLDALKKGIVLEKEEGAIIADLTKHGLGEKVLIRSDGTSLYITQDLYLALLRKKELNFDKAFYVVASEQNYHFRVLFTLLQLMGYKWASNLSHLQYGLVNLESGRMKSREGTVVDADDLVSETETLVLKELNNRYPTLSKEEKDLRASTIALSAIRYFFLKIEKIRDITFKPNEAIKFEGNTGPYLLYTYARAKSILRKANYKKKPYKTGEVTKKEKSLITHLSQFPQVAEHAYKNLAPNLIANYAYQLAQTFNEFYHTSRVLGDKNEQFKLTLVDSFSQVLQNSLSLLGIQTLEKM